MLGPEIVQPDIQMWFKDVIGKTALDIVLGILLVIPTWIVLTSIKDWWSFKVKKDALVRDLILSQDVTCEVGGKRGRFERMDRRRIVLIEEINGESHIHYVPIEKVINDTISTVVKTRYRTDSAEKKEDTHD